LNPAPRRFAALAGAACLALLGGVPAGGTGPATPGLRCDGAARSPRLAGWRRRAEGDGLYRYAVRLLGPPTGCAGKLEEAEGPGSGALDFSFAGGGALRIETAPPETSRVTLRVAGGFPDEPGARSELERYAKEIGVEIDWSRPAESSERGGERTETFWDREPGRNAGADLIYRGAKLVGIGLHLAL
jgi:hypothetical protein